ncbi:RagB/SusD family nutrient uptake outer membrane protein [Danxiaibacter flavus]|uniref:RagB/SusD family nutrient uptake outer membrane protein n=1 Tax=Danxiaibacter flavus TaxID=3049108 RepID=A0ABV3ZLW3_9BACT|nr:RagB/SusD family nutrient uptake outer membrane protein [Chitinophagaceae bacterium DXS]
MKRIYNLSIIALLLLTASCGKKFLEQTPQGQLTESQLTTPQGVEDALIGAYGLMNGNISGTWGNYAPAPSMWLFGEVAADDAHKGSSSTDQSYMNEIEHHTLTTTNDNLSITWHNYYEGIIRCNNTISLLTTVQNGDGKKLDDSRAKEVEAEAKMLRAHYYFLLQRLFVNIPYIDETTTTTAAQSVKNDQDVLPKIEADLQFAVANLPDAHPKGEVGRTNKLAAQAYLGKFYLYQKKYAEALTLFKTVIAAKPALATIPFQNNFNIGTENGSESIFTVQNVINSDGSGDNANVGDMLSGFYGTAPVNCCGFSQPSIDLVNSYKVDANGLPYLDNSYRTNPYTSDMLLSGAAKDNYKVNQTLAFDPRLDYTVGRRGVPYRDWGVMAGDAWIRDPAYAGPFVGFKSMINQADFTGNTVSGGMYITGLNINIIRLADVYLMAAECAIETGDLTSALTWVNAVRARAAKLPVVTVDGTPAADYKVGQYPSFPNADYARNAVRFERRLELAMEGHRFFDLVRWGIAKKTIESYSSFEGQFLENNKGITFDESKNTYYPIPQTEIDKSNGALKQNNGY